MPETLLSQSLTIETQAGVLPVGIKTEPSSSTVLIEMTQAPAEFVEFQGSKKDLAKSLGVHASDFHPTLPIVYGSTGTWTLIVPCLNRSAVESMKPTSENFPNVLTEIPRSSVHPFSMGTVLPDADLHGRHFSSPYSGTTEDPITGTASGVMGAYLAKYAPSYSVEKNYTFTVEQGFEVGRKGQVQVEVLNRDEPFVVKIAGTGVFVQDLSISL